MNTIGGRISALRKEHGFSQEYVAEKLDVSRQAVSKWEQDLCAPDTYNLIALAELFSVTVEYIAVGKEETKAESPATAPAPKTITVRQILGLIFVTVGLLATLLFSLIDILFSLVGIYLVIVGVLCLVLNKTLYLAVGWLHLIAVGLCFGVLGQRSFSFAGYTWASIMSGVFCLCLILLLIATFRVLIGKRPRKRRKD